VNAVAVYDAPIVRDPARRPSEALVDEIDAHVAAGRRSEAVELFLSRVAGVPPPAIGGMKSAPVWAALEAVSHTIGYDVRLGAEGTRLLEAARTITAPVAVLSGAASGPLFDDAAQALVDALPQSRRRTLAGQTHDVDPAVLAEALIAVRQVVGGASSRRASHLTSTSPSVARTEQYFSTASDTARSSLCGSTAPRATKTSFIRVNGAGTASFRVPSISIRRCSSGSRCFLRIETTSIALQLATAERRTSIGRIPRPSPPISGAPSTTITPPEPAVASNAAAPTCSRITFMRPP